MCHRPIAASKLIPEEPDEQAEEINAGKQTEAAGGEGDAAAD